MALALVISFFASVVPTVIYVSVFYWADRYEREPIVLLLAAFIWGAIPAIVVSVVGELLLGAPFVNEPGTLAEALIEGAVIAPVVEELAKGLALFALVVWRRQEFDGVLDGLIYGALIGFGFAMTENFFYFVGAYAEGGYGSLSALIILRSILFGLNHAFYTGLFGIGLGFARNAVRLSTRIVWILGGLTAAILAHSVHNLGSGLTAVYALSFGLSLGVAGGGFGLILLTILLSWQHERRCIRAELADEVGTLVTAREIEWLASGWRQPLWRRQAPNAERPQLLVELALRKYRMRRLGAQREPELADEIANLRQRMKMQT